MHILPDTPENRQLVDNVHPSGWTNPQPVGRYNLVVIGAGTAGLVCAAGAAGLGARVALIERHLMGGDCLNVGCVPSKALIRAARAAAEARAGADFGLVGNEAVRIDFGQAMERMRRLRAGLSRHDSARRFRNELGVDVFIGDGRFSGSDTVQVGDTTLSFARAAICTGARAAAPPIPGLEQAGYLTNESVFSLTELPQRLAVIGAGPIGCELAQTFARFGSRVTVLESAPQILGREDRDAADLLATVLVREGVELLLGVSIQSVERSGSQRRLRLLIKGQQQELLVDQILVGAGRTPNLEGLELEMAGVRHDRNGVVVSDTLQTSNPRVYAAGDICSPYRFTHTADAQARLLIANALFPGRRRNSSLTIPWCTYTDPEIAHVGLYPEEAQQRGIPLHTLTVPMEAVDRAVLEGDTIGFARVHLAQGSDQILGATVVGRQAGEMIGELAQAITNRVGLVKLAASIRPYPTRSEAIRKLGDAYNRGRLTPLVAGLLSRWLAWQRR